MSIELLYDYRGKPTGNLVIRAGEYAEDDAALFGLAAYLVENGHAVQIDETAEEPADEPPIDETVIVDKPTPKRK